VTIETFTPFTKFDSTFGMKAFFALNIIDSTYSKQSMIHSRTDKGRPLVQSREYGLALIDLGVLGMGMHRGNEIPQRILLDVSDDHLVRVPWFGATVPIGKVARVCPHEPCVTGGIFQIATNLLEAARGACNRIWWNWCGVTNTPVRHGLRSRLGLGRCWSQWLVVATPGEQAIIPNPRPSPVKLCNLEWHGCPPTYAQADTKMLNMVQPPLPDRVLSTHPQASQSRRLCSAAPGSPTDIHILHEAVRGMNVCGSFGSSTNALAVLCRMGNRDTSPTADTQSTSKRVLQG
jgi:hypothetical protein